MRLISKTKRNQDKISNFVGPYRSGRLTRRLVLGSLIAVVGSYSAAHMLFEPPAEAQSANGNAEKVHFTSGAAQIEAWLAKPKTPGKHAAVILIHNNDGLGEQARNVAQRFAAEGFVVLAPDLLSRGGGIAKMKTAEDAVEKIGWLPVNEVIGDLRAGFEFLTREPEVDPQKIASVGFGWGGWRSFMLATAEPKLYRAVDFCGAGPDSGFEKIQAPVLAHYAKWDNRIAGNALWIEEQMQKAGKKFQYYVYQADQSFFNEASPQYDANAAKLAWKRTLDFLRN